ncbi:MAG: YhbY family RNA-binding protein [Zoogloeaceae bacterium]|nr:YhbY family RNA-binding protein [Zoogloeaceae bacterium]
MLQLTTDERRALRARAHGLNPVVSISQNGLSEAVLKEIDNSLNSHELIKIRVYGDDRELRDGYLTQICDTLVAAPVQHIGKLLVVFRPSEKLAKQAASKSGNRKTEPRRTKRSFQGSKQKD